MITIATLHIVFVLSLIIIAKPQDFAIYPLQLPQKIHSHATGIYNNTLTIINGINDVSEPISGSYSVLLSPPSRSWIRNQMTMPLGTSAILIEGDTTVQIDNLLYIFNPDNIGNTDIQYNIMLVYDLLSHQYIESSTPLWSAAFPCAVFNTDTNIMYIIGGIEFNAPFPLPAISQTQTYHKLSNTWDTAADIHIARGYSGCAMDAHNDYIYLFGGAESVNDLHNNIYLDSIEEYSVVDNDWNIISQSMNTAKANIKCILLHENIYCSSQLVDDTKWDVFDPNDFTMDTVDINMPRILVSLSLWRDTCLMVTGGVAIEDDDDMLYFDSIEYLGECPPQISNQTRVIPTQEPTLNPTSNPTDDISQCFIGERCSKTRKCCAAHIDRRANGVSCGRQRQKWKTCCINTGFIGCLSNGDCCGRNSVCSDNVCYKHRQNRNSMLMVTDRETEHTVFSALMDNMGLLSGLCWLCVVVLIISVCIIINDRMMK